MDVSGLEEPALHSLLEPLGFHPLAIEDAARPRQRPKIDEFDDYFFLVTHEVDYKPAESDDQGVQDHQIGVFVRSNLLVTVHANTSKGLESLRSRCDSRNKVLHNGADFVLYNMLDVLVDG